MKIWDTTNFWGRVKEKADKKGIYLKDLAEECGMSQSTIFNQISLNQIPKKPGIVEKMAYLLGTTTDYLVTGAEEPVNTEPLTMDEKKLLLYFSSLSKENKEAILKIMDSLSK